MSDYDDKKQRHDANLGQEERRGDARIRERANRDIRQEFGENSSFHHEFQSRYHELSQEGKTRFNAVVEQGLNRKEQEQKGQQRARSFREISEENRRYQELLSRDDLKIGDTPFHGQAEIDFIKQTAKETVARREQGYLERIDRETRWSLENEIERDGVKQDRERFQDHDHDTQGH